MFTVKQRHMVFGPFTWVCLMLYAYVHWIIRKVGADNVWTIQGILCLPAVVFFGVVNILYNWTVGTLLFLELPREFMFTSRLKRHKKGPDGQYKDFATYVCEELNIYDPGHC